MSERRRILLQKFLLEKGNSRVELLVRCLTKGRRVAYAYKLTIDEEEGTLIEITDKAVIPERVFSELLKRGLVTLGEAQDS